MTKDDSLVPRDPLFYVNMCMRGSDEKCFLSWSYSDRQFFLGGNFIYGIRLYSCHINVGLD